MSSSGRHELDVPGVEDPGQEAQNLPDVLLRELHGSHGALSTANTHKKLVYKKT